ncbi:hypothetical protein [Microbacterium jejuense]|uniref:hypothetical protein n=1 Tax=Microbacterium jejuense TaxID=1263637 RepID=UPI0031E76541
MSTPLPSQTPNVVIESPKVRKTVRTVIDVIGALAFVAMVVDQASPAVDIAAITVPVLAGYGALRSVFGFVVDNRNTPS